MTHLKPSLLACAIAVAGLVACAHNGVDSPVQSGDPMMSTGSTEGAVDHGSGTAAQPAAQGTSADAANLQKRQHSSLTTPKSADYGSPTGSSSGSGANP